MIFLKALLKSGKFWAISGLVVAVLAFMRWGYGEIYDAGYNAADLKWLEAHEIAIIEAVDDARADWELSNTAAEENIRIETEIVERVRIVEREVPRIVERVVLAECRDLGPDIQRVFNDAIVASGNLQGSSSGPAAEVTN